jgi:hypothetical protein
MAALEKARNHQRMTGEIPKSVGFANPAMLTIETPEDRRKKYAYDVVEPVFELKEVLPAGMTVPVRAAARRAVRKARKAV